MSFAIDIFGYRYDDDSPAFVDVGDYWFHWPTKHLLTKTSVTAYMNSFNPNKTMGAKESGTPADDWLKENTGIPGVDYSGAFPPIQPPAATAPVTATVAGTGTDTATITFAGGPTAATGTVTLAANAGAAIAGLTPVAIAQGDTANAVAAKVAAALNNKQDAGTTVTLNAAAVGPVVTVTETSGANIATLTATVA